MSLDTKKLQHLEAQIKKLISSAEVDKVGEAIAKVFGYDASFLAVHKEEDNTDDIIYNFFGESKKFLEKCIEPLLHKIIRPALKRGEVADFSVPTGPQPLQINSATIIYNPTVIIIHSIAKHIGIFVCFNWKEAPLYLAKFDLIRVCTCFVNRVISLQPASSDFPNTFHNIIYRSEKMQEIRQQIELAAPIPVPILIRGETGVGKELVAHAIHFGSSFVGKKMVICDGGKLSGDRDTASSELFGHEKGAFTGAIKLRKGKFEQANKSTLFIDEVGEINMEVQASLLRAVQEGVIERLGSEEQIKVEVRLITATNKNIHEMVANGKFRSDLLARLTGIVINIPPLRERREDIPELTKYFLSRYSADYGKFLDDKDIENIVENLMPVLTSDLYIWPLNIRGLQWLVIQMFIYNRYSPDYVKDLLSVLESREFLSPVLSLNDINTSAEKVKQTLIEFAIALTQEPYISQIPKRKISKDERIEEALKWLNGIKDGIVSQDYADKFGIKQSTAIKELRELEGRKLIFRKGNTRSTRYFVKK